MYLVQARIQGQVTAVTCDAMYDDPMFPDKIVLSGLQAFVVGDNFLAKKISIPKTDVLFHGEGGIIPTAASAPAPTPPSEEEAPQASAQSNGNKPKAEKKKTPTTK